MLYTLNLAPFRSVPIGQCPHWPLFYATTHLTTSITNLAIQESCQRFYEHDWPAMLENPIIPSDGSVAVPELPGFGMVIKPGVWKHPSAIVQTSKL